VLGIKSNVDVGDTGESLLLLLVEFPTMKMTLIGDQERRMILPANILGVKSQTVIRTVIRIHQTLGDNGASQRVVEEEIIGDEELLRLSLLWHFKAYLI